MNRFTGRMFGALMAVFFVCAVFLSSAAAGDIVIAGTGASQDMLQAAAKEFAKSHAGVTFSIPDSVGTGGGIKAAAEGKAELGRVARKLKEKEKDLNLEYLELGKMALIFCANPKVPHLSLTAAQAADIFSGKVTNWKQVGGPDLKIRVVVRYEDDSTTKELRAKLEGWADLKFSPNARSTETDQENMKIIMETVGAVGFSSYGPAQAAKSTIFTLNGKKGTDPAYIPQLDLGLVYKKEKMTGNVKAFADFLTSDKGRKVLEQHGLLPKGK